MIHTKLASCTTVYNRRWLRCTWESVHRGGTKTILNKHRQRVQDQHQRVSSHNNHTASQVPPRRQPTNTQQIPTDTWRHDTISFHHKHHQCCCCKSYVDNICVVYANLWLSIPPLETTIAVFQRYPTHVIRKPVTRRCLIQYCFILNQLYKYDA